MPVWIVLVEDHSALREGPEQLLAGSACEVAAAAGSVAEGLAS